jgi:hypothetical protein
MGPSKYTHDTSFSLELMNLINKLECYIAPDWKGLLVTSTLAYWAHLQIMKTMKCWEYVFRDSIHNTTIYS